jgi:cytochrome c peroxidase
MSSPLAAASRKIATRRVGAAAIVSALMLASADLSRSEEPLYQLPPAGSYDLPVIDRVGRYELLDSSGARAPLLDLDPGSCAVISFVYASCPDAGGCPLVLASLRRMDRALASNSGLADRVHVVTVSFDPVNDTPEKLATLREHLKPKGDWRFLTSESDQEIRPILDDFGQDALRLVDAEEGNSIGVIRHIAKVFLVDSDRAIRNIYNTSFLDHDILLRDIETLLLEERVSSAPQ